MTNSSHAIPTENHARPAQANILSAGGWTQQALSGKPCHLFEPAADPHPGALLALHGADSSIFAAGELFTPLLRSHRLRAVCPHAAGSWWADRLCPNFDPTLTPERYLLESVLPLFAERWNVKPPLVAFIGIDMGGQAALRLALKRPSTFPIVAALVPQIDFHLLHGRGTTLDAIYPNREAARQDTALLHIHPLNWPRHLFFAADPDDHQWYPGAERFHQKLGALGISHRCDLETRSGGRPADYIQHQAACALAFVSEALHAEARRLETLSP